MLSTTELWRLLESLAQRSPRYVDAQADELVGAVLKKARLSDHAGLGHAASEEGNADSRGMEAVLEEGGPVVHAEDGGQLVAEYLQSVSPDAAQGRDEVERMGRCFSEDGLAFLSATGQHAGSGGYAEYLFRYAAQQLYGLDLWGLPTLPYKEGRNPDFAEVDINTVVSTLGVDGSGSSNGTRRLKFARAYGFRNIQGVMLKVRRGQCDYDFVEIMACPSGCNNGGGQLRLAGSVGAGGDGAVEASSGSSRETPAQSRERVAQVEKTFHSTLRVRRPEDSPLVQYMYTEGRLGAPLSEAARSLLHTRYHAVPKLDVIAPLATKW